MLNLEMYGVSGAALAGPRPPSPRYTSHQSYRRFAFALPGLLPALVSWVLHSCLLGFQLSPSTFFDVVWRHVAQVLSDLFCQADVSPSRFACPLRAYSYLLDGLI